MAIIFETWVAGRMARHAVETAVENTPSAVALRALDTFRASLVTMSFQERCEVLAELHALSVELGADGWGQFGEALVVGEN